MQIENPFKWVATPGNDPGLIGPGGSGETGHYERRSDQEINSLMDLMNSQASSAGGFPGDPFNTFAGTPAADPNNWRLTRADAESPLGYETNDNWRPNDQGGYFTLDQLFGAGRGGSMPSAFQVGSGAPSTNNWRLTVPFGGGPGFIMRNGMLIKPSPTDRGFWSGGNPQGAVTAEHGNIVPQIAAGTGSSYGFPNLYAPGYADPSAGWPSAANGWLQFGQRAG